MVNQELTLKQKQDITDIFNRIFDKPLNNLALQSKLIAYQSIKYTKIFPYKMN